MTSGSLGLRVCSSLEKMVVRVFGVSGRAISGLEFWGLTLFGGSGSKIIKTYGFGVGGLGLVVLGLREFLLGWAVRISS